MDWDSDRERETDRFAAGDYSFWSRIFEPISEELVDATGVAAGHRALDVAAGDGNTALAAARRGAIVTALDMSPAQIERGRGRTEMEGVSVAWVEGHARHLPFADDSFDRAFNSFGDEIAVDEMFRVVRPAGVVAITEWTYEGFEGALAQLQARFAPAGGGGWAPPLWGQGDYARTALEARARDVDVRRCAISAAFESADSFTAGLLQKDPYMHAFHHKLTAERWKVFCDEVSRLAADLASPDDGGLVLELTCLLSIGRNSEPTASRV